MTPLSADAAITFAREVSIVILCAPLTRIL